MWVGDGGRGGEGGGEGSADSSRFIHTQSLGRVKNTFTHTHIPKKNHRNLVYLKLPQFTLTLRPHAALFKVCVATLTLKRGTPYCVSATVFLFGAGNLAGGCWLNPKPKLRNKLYADGLFGADIARQAL